MKNYLFELLQGKDKIQNESMTFPAFFKKKKRRFPLTFKAWKQRSQISLTFQDFHDPYEPCPVYLTWRTNCGPLTIPITAAFYNRQRDSLSVILNPVPLMLGWINWMKTTMNAILWVKKETTPKSDKIRMSAKLSA